MNRRIDWSPRAIKDFDRLDATLKQRIFAGLRRLTEVVHGDVRRLQGTSEGLYRLRIGDWRVIFSYQADSTILVVRVLPRGSAYQKSG